MVHYPRGVKCIAHGPKQARQRVPSGPQDYFAKCENYRKKIKQAPHSFKEKNGALPIYSLFMANICAWWVGSKFLCSRIITFGATMSKCVNELLTGLRKTAVCF